MNKRERFYLISLACLFLYHIIIMSINLGQSEASGLSIFSDIGGMVQASGILGVLAYFGIMVLIVVVMIIVLFILYTLTVYPIYRIASKEVILVAVTIAMLFSAVYYTYTMATSVGLVELNVFHTWIVLFLLAILNMPLKDNGKKLKYKESLKVVFK